MIKSMKKTVVLLLSVLLFLPCGLCGAEEDALPVCTVKASLLLPEEDPRWELDYDYPGLPGEDPVSVQINDYYDTSRTEMTVLMLPMLSNSVETEEGKMNRMTQEYRVTCNNGRFFSVLLLQMTESGGRTVYNLESDTFDVSGEYAGQLLTLRGVVMVGESTVQLAECLMPVLYERFTALQEEGVIDPDLEQEDFEEIVYPDSHFYTNSDGSVTFYFQPEVMLEPSFDVPCFTFTPDELAALISE